MTQTEHSYARAQTHTHVERFQRTECMLIFNPVRADDDDDLIVPARRSACRVMRYVGCGGVAAT